ncbi:MAG: hypothetical protein KKA81_02800, partial [Bacteroidetes bacterium]|nr:hypothetical protein [Bacteroidota bacterium]
MLKNIIILFALCLSALCLVAQNNPISDGDSPEDVTSDLHHMLQYQGTEQNIKDFFLHSGTQFRNDTIYAILLPPMGCPRCEGIINPFILRLKKQDSLAE